MDNHGSSHINQPGQSHTSGNGIPPMISEFQRWFKLLVLTISPLLFGSTCGFAQMDRSITGLVRGQEGKPIYTARVHIARKGPLYGSRVLEFHETDIEGKFRISHVPWGTYVVMAGKEEDGYADTTGVFYSNMDVPEVDLGPLFSSADVVVHLGPKAGILHIASITDGITGQKIRNAGITLRRAANPKFFMTASSSVEKILVPSGIGVTVHIEVEGYQPWPPSEKAALENQIRLDPGQVFDLKVKLQPVVDPIAEITRMIHRTLYDHPLEISHGTNLTSPVVPAVEDVQRLRELGGSAINILSTYLQPSANILDQQVVISLLHNASSESALNLLDRFAESATSPAVRSRALLWLKVSNRPQDRALIRKSSIEDPAPEVRGLANDLLK